MKNILTFLVFLFLISGESFSQTVKSFGVDQLEIGSDSSASDTVIKMIGTNVQIRANKSTGKAEFTNDGSIWKGFGSGSGSGASGQTFNLNGSIEDGFAVNHSYTVGVASEVTGSSALEGEKSVLLDFTAENDFYRSDFFTVPKGLYGAACEMRFKYIGGGVNTFVKVENENGAIVGRYQRPLAGIVSYGLQALTAPSYESVFFKCPTQADVTANVLNGKVRYVVYQGTATNAAPLTIDLFSLGELIGLVESSTLDNFSAKVSGTGVVSNENLDWISGNCSLSGEVFTCTFNSGIFTVAPTCSFAASTGSSVGQAQYDSTSSLVNIYTYSVTGTGMAGPFSISCQKSGVDAKQSVQVYKSIPKIALNINSFNARVSSADAVSAENTDWINGNCTDAAAGRSICNFQPGIFSVAPNCVVSPDVNAVRIPTLSTNSSFVIVDFQNQSAVAADSAFTIICEKQGVDFKLPTVQPIVIGQVTNSAAESGIVNVRTESCKINNAGSAVIDTASGLCAGWVSSVATSGTGVVVVNFPTGTFSANPVCDVAPVGNDNINCFPTDSATTSSISTNCEAGTTAANLNSGFTVTCKGKR